MRAKLFIVSGTLLIASGAGALAQHAVAREARREGVEPEFFVIDDQDSQMRHAVHDARKTVGVFIKALQHPAADQRDFEVKKPFVKDGEVEHLWLSDVHFSGNRLHGRVDNRPQKIKGLKVGDLVSVNPDEITDWAFVENGKLHGGYTIRALYDSLSPQRKKELENELDFKITKH